jgi:hypothetical protein
MLRPWPLWTGTRGGHRGRRYGPKVAGLLGEDQGGKGVRLEADTVAGVEPHCARASRLQRYTTHRQRIIEYCVSCAFFISKDTRRCGNYLLRTSYHNTIERTPIYSNILLEHIYILIYIEQDRKRVKPQATLHKQTDDTAKLTAQPSQHVTPAHDTRMYDVTFIHKYPHTLVLVPLAEDPHKSAFSGRCIC